MDSIAHILASSIDAYHRCIEQKNKEWEEKHLDYINKLVKALLPSGAGWDNGTTIDISASTGEKLVFYGGYHHMDENGYYAGWTEHTITVRASLIHTLDIKISGRNRNDIKDYLHECFDCALRERYDNHALHAWLYEKTPKPQPAP